MVGGGGASSSAPIRTWGLVRPPPAVGPRRQVQWKLAFAIVTSGCVRRTRGFERHSCVLGCHARSRTRVTTLLLPCGPARAETGGCKALGLCRRACKRKAVTMEGYLYYQNFPDTLIESTVTRGTKNYTEA